MFPQGAAAIGFYRRAVTVGFSGWQPQLVFAAVQQQLQLIVRNYTGAPARRLFMSLQCAHHTICSGWKTSSKRSSVRKPSFTQASFSEIFSL